MGGVSVRRKGICLDCGGLTSTVRTKRCQRCYLSSARRATGMNSVLSANKLLFPRAYPGDKIGKAGAEKQGPFIWEVLHDGYVIRFCDRNSNPHHRFITNEEFDREWMVIEPNIMYPNGKHLEPDPDFLEAISEERREWLMTARSVKA